MDDLQMKISLIADIQDAQTKMGVAKQMVKDLEKELNQLYKDSAKGLISPEMTQEFASGIQKEIGSIKQNAGITNVPPAKTDSGGNSKLGSTLTKIGGAMLGVRALYSLIRKLVSNNEQLTSAVNGLFDVLSQLIAPILNTIASIIAYITQLLAKLFNVSAKNTDNSSKISKSVSGMDELNNLSSGSSTTSTPIDTEPAKQLFADLKVLAVAIAAVIAIAFAITTAMGIAIMPIGVAIAAIVVLVVAVIALVAKHWDDIKAWWDELMAKIGSAVKNFFDEVNRKFIAGLQAISDFFHVTLPNLMKGIATWIYDHVIYPVILAWQLLWDSCLKPTLQNILNGVGSIVNGIIKGINFVIRVINNSLGSVLGFNISQMSLWSVPQLATGTNYVPSDQLAYIHKGEAVVPKAFNENQYNNSEETNYLLGELITAVKQNNVNVYLDSKKIASGINQQSRILGGSLV